MITAGLLQDRAFISTWYTENAGSATKTIVIPTHIAGTYACTVDWGDGSSNYMTTYNDANWTHVYASTGTYTIKIYGKFEGLVFNNAGDRLKILTVEKWGPDFRLGRNQGTYFYGCSNLTITATDNLNLGGTVSLTSAFRSCTSLNQTINFYNSTEITSTVSMFRDCTNFNKSISTLDTSLVTNMFEMFRGCTNFNQSVSSLNTALNTNFNSTFLDCINFNQNISSWDVSKATTFNSFLNGCVAFNSAVFTTVGTACLDLSNTFRSCTIFNQAITGWNTANVTLMYAMFSAAPAFNQPLSFTTSKVTSMGAMFSGATAFNQDISAWSIAALTTASGMFNLSGFTITNYNKLLDSVTGWPSQATILTNVSFSAGTAHYSGANAIAGRLVLTGTKTWTITDGGTP